MNRLELRGTVRILDEEKGTVDLVAATGNVARDDALIEPSGWELENFRANPVVLWSHDALSFPVARAVDLQITENALTARAEFDTADPEAMRLFGKIQRGFVNATSVRWKPLETRLDMIDGKEVVHFLRQELLEVSFVSVPVDPKGLVMRADTGEPISVEDYRSAAVVTVGEEPAASAGESEEARLNGRLVAVEHLLADYLEARASRPSVEDMLIARIRAVTGTDESHARELIAAWNKRD
jgi:HK97 family phage prohead protease